MTDRAGLRIAIAPMQVRANAFVKAFSRSLAESGFEVYDYHYEIELPENTNAIILHWPNQFFSEQTEGETLELDRLLDAWQHGKRHYGMRLFWVAHNVRPHDAQPNRSGLAERFMATLDAIIYLSERSRELMHEAYEVRVPRELVCAHGDYRKDQLSPPTPSPPIEQGIKLGYFGKVRPYKGVDELISCVRTMSERTMSEPGFTLTVTGWRHDGPYSSIIEAMAAGTPEIRLDLRPQFVPEADLEAAIDKVHGVILPYRNIVNSGSTILALSRNRPVLAPRLGSLPEVQVRVGSEWLHLYDGGLAPSFLRTFVDHLRAFSPKTCDLSAFDWDPIGQTLRRFVAEICAGS